MKKYYNAIVGVAIVGVFVLGLTISGSASSILASISDVVGGQQAQVVSLSLSPCQLTDQVLNRQEERLALLKFLTRKAYTPYGDGTILVQGQLHEYNHNFDSHVIALKNALYHYQKDAGITVKMGSDGRPDPIVDTATRTHINRNMVATDCNSLTVMPYYLDTRGPSDYTISTYNLIGDVTVVEPGSNLLPNNSKIRIPARVSTGGMATRARGYQVSAIIYKDNSGPPPASRNFVNGVTVNLTEATVDGLPTWQANIKAPTEPGKYVLRILLRCAFAGSECDKAYGANKNSTSIITHFTVASSTNSDIELVADASTSNPHQNPVKLGWKLLNPDIVGVTAIALSWDRKYISSDLSYFGSKPFVVIKFPTPRIIGSYQFNLPEFLLDGVWDVQMEVKTKSGATRWTSVKNGSMAITSDRNSL